MTAPLTPWPLSILLVEDDDGDAACVERAFDEAGIDSPVVRAMDGVQALDILRGRNGEAKLAPPYMLLVDLNTPRLNGLQLVEEMRRDEQLHRCVVFVLTTSRRDLDKQAAYDLNVAGYIFKETVGADFGRLCALVDSYRRVVELP